MRKPSITSVTPEPFKPDAWRAFAGKIVGEDWFTVGMVDGIAHVGIFGEIGIGRHWLELVKEVAGATDIKLTVDSPGGDSIAGVSLFNALRGRVSETIIAGKCFSAALPIALAGQRIRIERRARILCHAPQTFIFAPAMQMLTAAKVLNDVTDELRTVIIQRTELPALVVESWLNGADVYFSAEQAVAYGLADEVYDTPQFIAPRLTARSQVALAEPQAELTITEDESLFYDFLNAFGRLHVHNRQNFMREVCAWIQHKTDEENYEQKNQ